MPGQKVLVAVDGSETSEEALRWYTENLYKEGDTVVLGHVVEDVIEPSFGFRAGLALPREQWQAMTDAQEQKVKLLKEKFTASLKQKNIACKFVREYGNPGHHLVDIASREHVDLVVMGTRGLGTMRRTILGSVSDYLIHHVHTPVCICRH